MRSRFARLWAWQAGIPDEGRVVLVGLVLLTVALIASAGAVGLAAPGLAFVLAGLGFNMRHPATATAAVGGIAIIVAIALVRSA